MIKLRNIENLPSYEITQSGWKGKKDVEQAE